MTNDLEHLFMHLLVICTSLVRGLFRACSYLSASCPLSFTVGVRSHPGYGPVSALAHGSSSSCGLFTASFAEQKFNEVQITTSLCQDYAFGFVTKNSNPGSRRLSPVLSSCFITWNLTLSERSVV